MWLKHGMRAGWQCNGNRQPRSESHMLIQFTLAYSGYQIYHMTEKYCWACLSLWLGRSDTQFTWGSCCSAVKCSVSTTAMASQELSLKMRIITFQNGMLLLQNHLCLCSESPIRNSTESIQYLHQP